MSPLVKTPIKVSSGWLEGQLIRRARKSFQCDYWRGRSDGCGGAEIAPGELYCEGECDPDRAGGFGIKRYCLQCAGEEVRADVARAEAAS